MDISSLPSHLAHGLLPLLKQVHALHVDAQPAMYPPIVDDEAVIQFLKDWIARDTVTALIAGPVDQPFGYLIFEITTRTPSLLRHGETVAMLEHISIDAQHRRRGIATALIANMRSRLRAQGLTRWATTYAAFNDASAALMRSQGLTPATIVARSFEV